MTSDDSSDDELTLVAHKVSARFSTCEAERSYPERIVIGSRQTTLPMILPRSNSSFVRTSSSNTLEVFPAAKKLYSAAGVTSLAKGIGAFGLTLAIG